MKEMILRELNENDKKEIMAMITELKNQNNVDDPFEGISDFGKINTYEELLDTLNLNKHIQDVYPNYVPQTTFGLFNSDNHVYGILNIRHYLVPSLMKRGGNIAYAIRPSERRKGYASLMLKLGLEKAIELHVNENSEYANKVLLTCRKENIGSSKTMLSCGAEFDGEEYCDANNSIEQRYWIDINKVLDNNVNKSL